MTSEFEGENCTLVVEALGERLTLKARHEGGTVILAKLSPRTALLLSQAISDGAAVAFDSQVATVK